MKRIAMLDNYYFQPDVSDFKEHDTNILLTRMLRMYVLKQSDKIEMVHLFQLNDIALQNKVQANLQNILCDFVEQIPTNSWDKILHELSFKQPV